MHFPVSTFTFVDVCLTSVVSFSCSETPLSFFLLSTSYSGSRRWSWATVRKPKLSLCKCCSLSATQTSIASTKWTVTMVTPWSIRSSSSPNASSGITCWRWVPLWTFPLVFLSAEIDLWSKAKEKITYFDIKQLCKNVVFSITIFFIICV